MIRVALLTGDEAATYWDARHQQEGDLRSGGDISFDEATNHIFYIRRLGLLVDIIGNQSEPTAPLYLLDAGCGKGWFSRELAKFGHAVDGIDGSESAIAHCRRLGGGPRYCQSTLGSWTNPWLYDVVVSIDVVFHILDHAEWERAVRNLASHVRLGGRLIVADWFQTFDREYGDYQVLRSRDRYFALAQEQGLNFDGWHAYNFRQSPVGFYLFSRYR